MPRNHSRLRPLASHTFLLTSCTFLLYSLFFFPISINVAKTLYFFYFFLFVSVASSSLPPSPKKIQHIHLNSLLFFPCPYMLQKQYIFLISFYSTIILCRYLIHKNSDFRPKLHLLHLLPYYFS